MNTVRLLQCGHDKSGTYLLFRILSQILSQNNLYRSFVASSGIGRIIDSHFSENKRFPEVNQLDYIRKQDGQWGLNFPSPTCRHIPVDLDLVLETGTLIYTHEPTTLLEPIRQRFTHRIYLLRDGRDVVNSLIHFLTNDISLKLCPEYTIRNPAALYRDLSYFRRLVCRWEEHVRSFTVSSSDYMLVKFEEILEDRTTVITALCKHLGLDADLSEIAEHTSLASMKNTAPKHVRKGRIGDWNHYFSARHKKIFKEVAGDLLIAFRYEDDYDW